LLCAFDRIHPSPSLLLSAKAGAERTISRPKQLTSQFGENNAFTMVKQVSNCLDLIRLFVSVDIRRTFTAFPGGSDGSKAELVLHK